MAAQLYEIARARTRSISRKGLAAMMVVDANLVYAHHRDFSQHDAALTFFEDALSGVEPHA